MALACASAGIIIGAITLTGLGLKLGNGLVELAGGNLLLTLIFTMITSLILGMGVPTTANYIITSTIAAPALILLGVHPLAAHMFVFYFGIMADITPPVALAAYAGAGHCQIRPSEDGRHCHQTGHRRVSDALHLCLQPRHALDQYDVVRDAFRP